ncbi:MAG: hypothetical protein HeimC2_34140 [Candidatus Heimdallarchaeota archaeon LC_2]|nr:MAG: hypothetical protein HeimC2_34140 [Candidatus Heimdallarchaeota archaeon LC_2]
MRENQLIEILQPSRYREFGYAILINNFEVKLRKYLQQYLILKFGDKVSEHIPSGILTHIKNEIEDTVISTDNIAEAFDTLYFDHLKEIASYKKNFESLNDFIGEVNVEQFRTLMIKLNFFRNKIAHVRHFSYYDFLEMIDHVNFLCNGVKSIGIREYIVDRKYYDEKIVIPPEFILQTLIINNLPVENYDFDGGFVGRKKELSELKLRLLTKRHWIFTVIGAGGVGKSAIALKTCYDILMDINSPFTAISWFSAKTNRLEEDGILNIKPDFSTFEELLIQLFELFLQDYETEMEVEIIQKKVYEYLENNCCLIVIDNLETVIQDNNLISFIKEIPPPSKLLITSRRGLGELERRIHVGDMEQNDAIILFRILSRVKKLPNLVNLKNEDIGELVNRVKNYPLLIKWSLGQVALGKPIEKSFSAILSGESEIAQFVFNDIYDLISENSKLILYSFIIGEDENMSKPILSKLTDLGDDDFFDAITELVRVSFILPSPEKIRDGFIEKYSILELTRGFIEFKLRKDVKNRKRIIKRKEELTSTIREHEKIRSILSDQLIDLGIETDDDKLAYEQVRVANNYIADKNFEFAETHFKEALKLSNKLAFVHREYSAFLYKKGDFTNAEKHGNKAIKLDPEAFDSWINIGRILINKQDYAKAKIMYQKALELNSNYLPIYNELGSILTKLGLYKDAENLFEQAINLKNPPNFRHLASVYCSRVYNARQRAESFRMKNDKLNQLNSLKNAYLMMDKAIGNPQIFLGNPSALTTERRNVILELGIAYWLIESNFEFSIDYIKRARKSFKIKKSDLIIEADRYSIIRSHYWEIKISLEKSKFQVLKSNQDFIKKLVLAQEMCRPIAYYRKKIDELLKNVHYIS